MSLIKCVECNSDISHKAIFCPHCGCPIAPSVGSEERLKIFVKSLCDSLLEDTDLPFPTEGVDMDALLARIEKKILLAALRESRWNYTIAAKVLKLTTRSMRYHIEKYNLKEEH